MFEVEKRAFLGKPQHQKLLNFLHKNARYITSFKRLSLISIERADFVPSPESEIDIRIRLERNKARFTLKKGNWHNGSARAEHEIDFDPKQIKDLLYILICLNYKYYVMTYIERHEFAFQGCIVTIDEHSLVNKYLLDAEKLVKNKKDVSQAEKSVIELMQDTLKLNIVSSQEMQDFVKDLNLETRLQVNFDKISVENWFEKWQNLILLET